MNGQIRISMTIKMNHKQRAIITLERILNQQELDVKQSISLTKESRDGEQKSTSGDKHETSRATTQHELDKYEAQLNKIQQMQADLHRVKQTSQSKTISLGSYIITNHHHYFLSVGMGNITDEGIKFFAISLASPIGKLLYGKKVGEKFTFQHQDTQILEVF